MNINKQLSQRLQSYGIDIRKQSQRSIQQKIIQMYESLELKTTQNLLLRKQNDDIKLQIHTIQDVFNNVEKNINSISNKTVNVNPYNNLTFKNGQINKFSIQTDKEQIQSVDKPNYEPFNSNNIKMKKNIYKQQQNTQFFGKQSTQTQQKTPRYCSKTHRNSRFCDNKQTTDKQKTSRMTQDKKYDHQQNNLNEKIQLLMKQNQIILKRMNQIQVNFINKSQRESENSKYHKNYDDRSTHFSSNITSIQNIWHKKQNSVNSRGLSAHNRNHYSTSNLRSYCPTID